MKKLFLAIVFSVVAFGVYAGTTVMFTINATVLPILDVSSTLTTWPITITNDGLVIENENQSTLTVKSSKRNYTISFTSTNNGVLSDGTDGIAYYIKVDTDEWVGVDSNELENYVQLTTKKTMTFVKRTPIAGKTFAVGFKVLGYSEYYADGNYSDTVTVEITSP